MKRIGLEEVKISTELSFKISDLMMHLKQSEREFLKLMYLHFTMISKLGVLSKKYSTRSLFYANYLMTIQSRHANIPD